MLFTSIAKGRLMKKLIMPLTFAFSALLATPAAAQTAAQFPNKNIRFIVPFTAGTGMDQIARRVGDEIQKRWGQGVVIENRLGASGHVGAQLVAQAPADGHTLVVTARNLTITASLFNTPGFSPQKDLTPITIAAWGTSTLVTGANSKFNSLTELIAMAKANPGKMNFASAGIGSPSHLALENLQAITGAKFLHVPYNGTAPVVNALISGEVDVALLASHTMVPHVNGGKLKAVAAAGQERNRSFPNVPSFAEFGYKNFSDGAWYGFLAPAATPADIVQKWQTEIAAILKTPGVMGPLEKLGLDVRPSTSAEMAKQLQGEYELYADIIKKNNIKAN